MSQRYITEVSHWKVAKKKPLYKESQWNLALECEKCIYGDRLGMVDFFLGHGCTQALMKMDINIMTSFMCLIKMTAFRSEQLTKFVLMQKLFFLRNTSEHLPYPTHY
jgi:hypothetical protein